MIVDAKDMHYRDLNARIRESVAASEGTMVVRHAEGQRYIGAGLGEGVDIEIAGIPGNDLGAFMNGAEIVVDGNVQDGVGNTMNAGRIVVHGDAGDILGHSMRGGQILVRGSVGYRTCIHMKAYGERRPTVVIGGVAGDYLGEYMAGGTLVVLGLDVAETPVVGRYVGTGMHGGAIFIRGSVAEHQLGAEVGVQPVGEEDWATVSGLIETFCSAFEISGTSFEAASFIMLTPKSSRPYGTLYAY